MEKSIEEVVADILMVITEVGVGNLEERVPVSGEGGAAVDALASGINKMIDRLVEERLATQGAYEELERKVAMIEAQRSVIVQMSTPIFQVWDDVLCLPVVGTIDPARATQMTGFLLEQVARLRARAVIVDITGIDEMDTQTVRDLVDMARGVFLLGAKPIITGVSPAIAQTLAHLGVELGELQTLRSVRDALRLLFKEPVAAG